MSAHWQNKRATASHADDWLMTYADMITLLLCFFVIFLIISISKKETHKDTTQQTVAEVTSAGSVTIPVKQPDLPPPTKYPDVMQGNLPFHDRDPDDYAENDKFTDKSAAVHADTTPHFVGAPQPADAAPTPLPAPIAPVEAEKTKPPAPVAEAPPGDRITMVEINSAAFFASGSAELSENGKNILRPVAADLKSDKYKGYRITVEGYTDDTPIHTAQFPSNWELSSARASAVVQFFLHEGLPAQRMRAAGYADSDPKAPNRDADGHALPANQALNRRVVIELEKIETAQQPAIE